MPINILASFYFMKKETVMEHLSMEMDYEKVDNLYRPMPFWSWNDMLNDEQIIYQIEEMHEKGIGGFVIHARAGLKTPYMENDWFHFVQTAITTAAKFKMKVWIYDENGWPSGFGNGKVNGKGEKYQQKYLRMEKECIHREHSIKEVDGIHFYYECNPFYVDNLNADVVKVFIGEVYEKYYEKFGNTIEGFFTDEPQLSRDGIPWSECLPEFYKQEYGEDLLEHLPELFLDRGDHKKTRVQFWRMLTILFSESYVGQIGKWCHDHALKLTGHLLLEETLESQLTTNGACMPSYYYFDVPGVDWLGGQKKDILSGADYPLSFKQVESVAHQFGKQQILSESFAAAGHDLSFSEMRGLVEWQMVRGINVLCPHLQGYSNRGVRKRDFPPAMYLQQPWWDVYKKQNDYLGMVGACLGKGTPVFHTLLIHNISSAWADYTPLHREKIQKYQEAMEKTMQRLEQLHILFHLGDEILMEKYAYVENGKLVMGKQEYDLIILPKHCVLLDATRRLLKEFQRQGGRILETEQDQSLARRDADVIDSEKILYTQRQYENGILHYYVNPGKESVICRNVKGEYMLDPSDGKWKEFYGYKNFRENESLLTFSMKKAQEEDALQDRWTITDRSENALLLDHCDYYFDGILQEKNAFVLDILEQACERKEKVEIELCFLAEIENLPAHIFLAGEDWEKYEIFINGAKIEYLDSGKFIDESIRKIDIHNYIRTGKNEIRLKLNFVQPDSFYDSLEKAYQFESERNKLTYPVEIEPIYIVGDFGVYAKKPYHEYGEEYSKVKGEFYLDAAPKEIYLKNMETQGFPFFAGTMHVKKTMDILPKKLEIFMHGIQSVDVYADGKKQGNVIWQGEQVEILQEELKNTETHTLEFVMRSNLRNLWGPHHCSCKERFTIWPNCFYKRSRLYGNLNSDEWTEDYVLRHQTVEKTVIF